MPKQDAIALFTDRTEPQAAFASAYLAMAGASQSHVLAYYGMGGIGKSTLLTKLEHNLSNDPDLTGVNTGKPLVVNFNFERHQEDIKVLMSLRNMLGTKYKWRFPRFELGLYLYSQNIGEDADAPEDEGYLEKSGLKPAVEIAGEIPILGSVLKAISILDQGQAAVRTLMKQHSAMVKEFEELSAEEQREALPALFAADLNSHSQKAKSPLVVMLDTFECVTETSGLQDALFGRDYWLYGENGLIPTAKNVLFVIAGRNKLKWEPEGFTMEQLPLGALTPEDAADYLTAAGVPESLRGHLCRLTDGVPVYLDVCVRQYNQLVGKHITPEKEHFGGSSEVLIRRYVRYMDKSEKELVRMLVFLPEWDQALVREAAKAVLGSFSLADYNRVVKLSIVSESDKGRYFIHRTVADILRKDPDNSLRQDTATFLADHCRDVIKSADPFSDAYSDAAANLLHAGLMLHEDRDALADFYYDHVELAVDMLNSCHRKNAVQQIMERYWTKAQEVKDDWLYAAALQEKLWRSFQLSGVSNELLEQALDCLQMFTRLKGEQDFKTLSVLSMTAIFFDRLHMPRDAIPAYEYMIRMVETYHPDAVKMILNGRRNVALSYQELKEYDRALSIFRELVKQYREQVGPEERGTIRALRDLAICHRYMNAYSDARQIGEEALALSRKVLKEDHPDMLLAVRNLIATCEKMKDYPRELELREELIALHTKHHGEDHPDTLNAMIGLGNCYSRNQEDALAIEVREQILARHLRLNGTAHKSTLETLRVLAFNYYNLKNYDRVCQLLEPLIPLREKVPDAQRTMDTIIDLLKKAYMEIGAYDKAAALLQQALSRKSSQNYYPRTRLIGQYKELATCYDRLGNCQAALQVREDALKLLTPYYSHRNAWELLEEFNGEYLRLGMPELALELHRRFYGRVCRIYSDQSDRSKALALLMKACLQADHEEDMRLLYQNAVEQLETKFASDPQSMTTAKLKLAMALCFIPEILNLVWPLMEQCLASYNPFEETEYSYDYKDGASELFTLVDLADHFVETKEFKKAFRCYMTLRKYPPDGEDSSTYSDAMIEILNRMGREGQAMELRQSIEQEKAESDAEFAKLFPTFAESSPSEAASTIPTPAYPQQKVPPLPSPPPPPRPPQGLYPPAPPQPAPQKNLKEQMDEDRKTQASPSTQNTPTVESYLDLSWQDMMAKLRQRAESRKKMPPGFPPPVPKSSMPPLSLAELMEKIKKGQKGL